MASATKKLDIINSMIATTGVAPLAASDTTHPSYLEADSILEEVLEDFGAKQLWFNTSKRTLQPDSVTGQIVLPSNTMDCAPTCITDNFVVRGRFLFDMTNNTDNIAKEVECYITVRVALNDMPPAALQYVRAEARLKFFVDQDGSDKKIRIYEQAVIRKSNDLESRNLRLQRNNYFLGLGYAQFATRRGARGNFIRNSNRS